MAADANPAPADGLTPAQFAELARLPPQEAMRWMQGRAHGALTYSWQDLMGEEHGRQFTISRLARLDLLQSLHESLSRSVSGDLSRRDWIRDTEQLLRQSGWWGEKQMLDPNTGKMVKTTFDPARLQLIYDTNTRQAASRGQWERALRAKDSHPYLRYITLRDDRVRAEHAAWDDVTLPIDHPFWQTHRPPCAYRCRCRYTSVNRADYDKGVTPRGTPMVKKTPPAETREVVNRRTGEIMNVPKGVDPGFGTSSDPDESLRKLTKKKLKSATPAIANAAQYEGLSLQSAAATYAEKARLAEPGNENKMPPLALSPIFEPALAQLRELSLPVNPKVPLELKMLGLEHDGTRHVWIEHGLGSEKQQREVLRGQVPIEPGDIAAFPEIFNRAALAPGNPPLVGGTPMVSGRAVFGEFRYEFAARVGRHLITVFTLYKWRL